MLICEQRDHTEQQFQDKNAAQQRVITASETITDVMPTTAQLEHDESIHPPPLPSSLSLVSQKALKARTGLSVEKRLVKLSAGTRFARCQIRV